MKDKLIFNSQNSWETEELRNVMSFRAERTDAQHLFNNVRMCV